MYGGWITPEVVGPFKGETGTVRLVDSVRHDWPVEEVEAQEARQFTLALQKKSAMPPSKDYEGYATRVL